MLLLTHFTYGPEGNQWHSDTSKTVILLFWHRKAVSLVQEFRDISRRGSNMPSMIMNDYGMCEAEMFLDSDTRRAFIMKDPVPWYDKEAYQCEEPDPCKILHEILQLMKSHSAEDFKTIKDHLESLQAQWSAHEADISVETESLPAGWIR